jgi:agmatine/peptidylarginine deiminase
MPAAFAFLAVGIHAVDLVWGFGWLHCLTQQQPV